MPRFNLRTRLMIAALTFVGSGVLMSAANAQRTGRLTVQIDGLASTTGDVCLQVFNRSQGFPGDAAKAVRGKCYAITQTPMTVTFDNLPAGNYAVAAYHDSNRDRQLNRNGLGIPREGYGFSNNPPLQARAAKFQEAAFLVAGQNTQINVRLRYLNRG